MATLLLNKAITVPLLQDHPRDNMEHRHRANMEHLHLLTAAISKHPQARLRRRVLATCLDRRHPSTCLAPLMRFAKP